MYITWLSEQKQATGPIRLTYRDHSYPIARDIWRTSKVQFNYVLCFDFLEMSQMYCLVSKPYFWNIAWIYKFINLIKNIFS